MRKHNPKRDSEKTLTEDGEKEISQHQLKQLIESSPLAMIVSSGRDERVEMVNAKFTAVFGYTIEDMPDVVHWWPLAYPDEAYREAVRSQWSEKTKQAIQNKNEIEPMEATVRCRDGSYRHVEFRLSSVGDRHLVTFLDLTEQKRTEEALRYSEARIRSIIDAVAEGIVFQASDGTIIEANKSAERILGLTQEQALGRTSIDPRWHSIREDGSLFPGQDHPAMVTLRTGEPQSQVVMGINKPDGTQTWISINSHPLFRPNETLPYAVVASFHDITERKQAEEALKKNNALLERIFSSTEFLIAYLDPNFNFIRVNRAYAEADQQTPEYFVGKNHFSLYPNEKNEKIFRNVLATGEAHTVYAGPFVYPTHPERGTTYWNWTLHPVKEADGSITGLVLSMVDVTARERAIIAQHESDARYRTLVEQASDGIFVADPQGNYIDVNPSGCAMLGYTREELLTLSMQMLVSPENMREKPLGLDQLRAGKSVTTERELVTKSGALLLVEISGKMLDNGNFLGIVRDITERKQMEEALRESERRLIAAQQMAHVGYWERDFDTNRVVLSDEACRIFGISEQVLSLNLDQWHPRWVALIHPEDQPRLIKLLGDVLAGIGSYDVEYRVIRPDGAVRYIYSQAQVQRDASGNPRNMLGMMQDITDRKQAIIAQQESDARYRVLVEQASDGIFVSDPQGNYIDVNPRGCAMLGYTREELLTLSMQMLTSPKSLWEKPLGFDKLQAGKSVTTERELVTKSGALLPVEISGKMLDNGNFLGIVRDITERKRHERERNAIINISAALRQATTRSDILNIILNQLEEVFTTDGVVLVLPDPQSDGFIDEMGRGVVGERVKGLSIPPGKGVCNWVIANKKPYLNNHAENDPLFYRPDLLGDSHCLASVPLIAQEQAIGALWIARKMEITQDDLRLLSAIADIAASAIHRATLNEQIEQQVRHLLALHQIDVAITTNFNLGLTLDIILKHVKTELGVDAANILLLNPVTNVLHYTAGIGFFTRNIERSQIKLGEDFAGRAALEYRTASCPDLRLAPTTFSRSSLLADEKFISHYVTPLIIKGQVKGVLEVFHRSTLRTDPDWTNYFETLATQTAIAIENDTLLENLQKSNTDLVLAYDATIEGWSRALDMRDEETEGHSQRVTEMTLQLAEKMEMSDAEKANLRRGALLHDIGKMGVPDSILRKPGALSEDEWVIMRQHPTHAYNMLSPITYLKHALDIPYCHHERWDGSGYPRGLKGEDIPLAARVFAVVDVYDALISDRPYRKAWSHEDACRYLQENAGKLFDPKVVEIFLKMKQG